MGSILLPEDYEWARGNLSIPEWRALLKRELYRQREYKSDLSSLPIQSIHHCHLHEGIITRASIPFSVEWQWRIFASPNCFLLLPSEHIPNPPSREWAIERAYELYGRDVVRDWFYDLPFKSIPFQLP